MAPEQAVVLVAMTGSVTVDDQMRATAEALKRRLQERGFRDVDPARLNQAMREDPSGVGTLRTRLGAACSVRVDVQAHDAFGVSLLAVVQTNAGEQSVNVQSSLVDVAAKVLEAVEPLLPTAKMVPQAAPPVAPTPVQPQQPPPPVAPSLPTALDRVVLTDGTVLEGVLMGFAGGNSVTLRMAGETTRTIPWHQVKQIIPNAQGDSETWGWAKDSDKRPEADWSKRGGSLLTMDLQAQLLGLLARSDHAYLITYPDDQTMTFTGDSPAGGGGAAIGFHVGYMNLQLPDPADSTVVWALRAGTGIDLGYSAFAYRTDNSTTVGQMEDGVVTTPLGQEGGETKWTSASVVMVPLFFGAQVGSGKFVEPGVWRGVLFGIDWRPTYTYAKPSDFDGIGSFNYLGIQAHVDMATISADSDGLEPNFRISVTYLPRIDREATYALLGFGAAWY